MKSKQTHLFLGYWFGLNAAKWRPGGDCNDDQILGPLSPYTFILGGDVKRSPVYWIAGRAKQRMLGRNPREEEYAEVWDLPGRSILKALLTDAVDSKRPIYVTSTAPRPNGRMFDLETILVPVDLESTGAKALIGITVPTSDVPESKIVETGPRRIIKAGFVFDAKKPSADIIEFPRTTLSRS
jgi:hypothetical protein